MKQNRLGRIKVFVILGALLLASAATVGIWIYYTPRVDPTLARERYELAIEAVAATEETDFRRALDAWGQLLQKPDVPTAVIQLNQAVTLLKWIDELDADLNGGGKTQEQTAVLEKELDAAYTLVESTVDSLNQAGIDGPNAAFVEASLLEKKASRVEEPESTGLRKRATEVLISELAKSPGNLLLTGKFDELASELARDDPTVESQNADLLFTAFQANSRNLFALKRASEVLLRAQDPRLQELLQPSIELTKSMVDSPAVARIVARLDPPTLVESVAKAIAAGKWNEARRLQGWLNTIIGMPAFKSDSRLAKPDVLALLDSSFLVELSDAISQAASLEPPDFETVAFEAAGQLAVWYDLDLDTEFEVATLDAKAIKFFEADGTAAENAPTLEGAFAGARGMLPVDLFEVGRPGRPLPPASVRELMAEGSARDQVANKISTNQQDEAQQGDSQQEDTDAAMRHDTLQELVVWGDFGIQIVARLPEGQFSLLDQPTGLESLKDVICVAPSDFESDGDLDLAIAVRDGFVLMQNNGNRTFENISRFSDLPESAETIIAGDFDFDTDQDFYLLVPGESRSSVVFLENLRHSEFRTRAMPELTNSLTRVTSLAVADLDGNASWDVVASGQDGSQVTLTRLLEDGTIGIKTTRKVSEAGQASELQDVNNDGFIDLLLQADGTLTASLGDGQGDFAQPKRIDSGSKKTDDETQNFIQSLDANGDGALDVLSVTPQRTVVYRGEPSDASYVSVRIKGINDINGGGRINHYALGSTLQLWADGLLQSRIINQPSTHFGIGNRTPDNLRIIFPNGLTQNIEDVTADTMVEERQVLRGSCPFVYGWTGERFELITDLLWNAPLGLQVARGVTLPDRRWEHLLIPGKFVQPRNGFYELRITEELWEVAYFDQVQFVAIDHPARQQIFTNEKVGPPSLATPKVFATDSIVRPTRASDSQRENVLAEIIMKDQVYAQPFERLICQGLSNPHFVELDFGDVPREKFSHLVLTGWMYPTDTSLNIGIDQNTKRNSPEPPSLWVVDEAGNWICKHPFMGFPGGKPKSIVIDLTGVFETDDRRIRIAGSQQIYWDEAFLADLSEIAEDKQERLELESAVLHFRGFSQFLPREPDQPHWYDYQHLETTANWPPLDGPFTTYGDVRERLTGDDDRMVVMTSGDEIILRFKIPNEPTPEGFERDFVLKSVGWDKDADLNTLAGFGSLPLPFASQLEYPPPPEQASDSADVWEKNRDSLQRKSGYLSRPLLWNSTPLN